MKKLIRKIFNRFGYDIVKSAGYFTSKGNTRVTVRVGNFDIVMAGSNTLIWVYANLPDYNRILGRINDAVLEAYPGMTAIDIGANVGDTIAIIRSTAANPVIGIEGDNTSYALLEENCRQFRDVYPVKCFVGDKPGEITASVDQEGRNNTIVPDGKGSSRIQLTTVDILLSEQRFQSHNVKLIKYDIEGFDTIAMRGSLQTIRQHHPILFLEYNPKNMAAIGEDGLGTIFSLADEGYDKAMVYDHEGRLLLSSSLSHRDELAALHTYSLQPGNLLGHYDICLFHAADNGLADRFLQKEKARQVNN